MDALTALMGRRSIRRFTSEPVSEADIRTLLMAAMAAPTAKNAREVRYVVITNRAILDQAPSINPYAAMAKEASLGIMVCGDLQAEVVPGYWPQDTAAAMENLLIAAHALGLGAVWTGVYPLDRVAGFRKLLNLPDHIMPLGLAIIGHPAVTKKAHDEYTEEFVHYDKW